MVSIKHAFQSVKADDPAASADGQITPSRWNADLDTSMATGRVLGRSTAGTGAIEELDAATARTLLQLVKGTSAGNIPVLDGGGKLDTSILPSLAIKETFVINSQSAMLALTAQTGDVAIRTDLNKTFILSTNNPGTLADWKEMLTPTDAVLSVAGLTGAISAVALKTALAIAAADITDASANGRALITAANYAAMRTLLGLVIGANVQAYDADLATIAGLNLSGQDGKVLGVSGGAFALISSGGSMKKHAEGYIDTTTFSTGTGEETRYFDVTISALPDKDKARVDFDGSGSGTAASAGAYSAASAANIFIPLKKLTSTTNLRISTPGVMGGLKGRYTVWDLS